MANTNTAADKPQSTNTNTAKRKAAREPAVTTAPNDAQVRRRRKPAIVTTGQPATTPPLTAEHDNDEAAWDTETTAAFFGVSPRTLEGYRVTGDGPPFFRIGVGRGSTIRYLKSAALAWARDRQRSSTRD